MHYVKHIIGLYMCHFSKLEIAGVLIWIKVILWWSGGFNHLPLPWSHLDLNSLLLFALEGKSPLETPPPPATHTP